MPSDGNIEAPSFQQIEGQLRHHEVLETKPSLAATNPVRRVIRVGPHLGRFADSVTAKKEASKQKQTASVDGQNFHQLRTTSATQTHQSPGFAVRDEKHMDAAQGQDVLSQKSESF